MVAVAQAWLTLDADQQRSALAQSTLQSRQRSLELVGRRHALGAATALDMATGQAAVETARGDLAALAAQVGQDRNALRLLVGVEVPTQTLPADRDSSAADAAPAKSSAQLLLSLIHISEPTRPY